MKVGLDRMSHYITGKTGNYQFLLDTDIVITYDQSTAISRYLFLQLAEPSG